MFDLVIGTLLSSFCNFVAQHIYTELLTKPGEVKYPQVRLNPANICQRRQISADFFRSAQSVHFLAPEYLNHCATLPPKTPHFLHLYVTLLYLYFCQGSFFDRCLLPGCRTHSHTHPCVPVLPPPVCGSMSGSKSQERGFIECILGSTNRRV